MPLPKETVTFDIADILGEIPAGSQLLFRPSGFDTDAQAEAVIIDRDTTVPVGADGTGSVQVWANDRGLRGTHYEIYVLAPRPRSETQRAVTETLFLGRVVVGSGNAWTLRALLDNPVPDTPSWNVNIAADEYTALRADMDALITSGTSLLGQTTAARDVAVDAAAEATADAVQVADDRIATAADRVQTGLDRVAAETARGAAETASSQAQAFANSAQSISRTVATWAALSPLTGSVAGEGAEVLDADAGAHTDPVVGGTVSNAGRYSWSASPAGWRRIGATGLAAKADLTALQNTQYRVYLRTTATYLNFVKVDRGAATVSFPPLRVITATGTVISIGTLDVFITLALSTAPSTRVQYYVDLADNTIKSSTTLSFAQASATVVPLGWSENYGFQSLCGHRVKFVSDDAPNVRVWTEPGSTAGLGSEFVLVDRVRQVVAFPRVKVWRAFSLSVVTVNPPGWAATPRIELPLSTAFATPVWYYVDLATLTFGSTTTWNSPLQSDTIIYIGSSGMGSFSSQHGLPVKYVQNDTPPLGRVSMDGLAREAQGGWQQTQYSSRIPYLHNGTKWHAVQPLFPNDMMRSSGTGGIDLTYFPTGTRLLIRTFGQVTTLWAGRGRTFLGTTSNAASIPANSAVTVISTLNDVFLEPCIGTISYSTISEPVMDRSILLAGQSQRVIYGESGGIGGFMRALRTSGWLQSTIDTSINWCRGATGGTAIDRRSVDVSSTAYWWDAAANGGLGGPGPALTTCVAAMAADAAAGQPAPSWVFWAQGESDGSALVSGALTIAQMVDSIGKVWAYIRANGASGAKFLVTSLGSREGAPTEGIMGARDAYLQAIAANSAFAFQGMDFYDLPRAFGEVHLHDRGYSAWGAREALAWANLEFGQTNNLGPTFSTATLSANKKSVTIAYTRSGPIYSPAGDVEARVCAGPQPFGIGIIPSGAASTATAVNVVRGYLSGSSLVLDTDQDLTGCRVVFPYGGFPDHRAGQFVRDYRADDYHTIPGLPMRTFVSAPLA